VPDLALEVSGLYHTFRRGSPNEIRALDGVDLALEAGAFVVMLGANGSGKSTLLNAVAGTLIPERGSIRLAGQDVTGWPEHRRARMIRRVFQDPFTGTAPHLTIAENLGVASRCGVRRRGLRRALTSDRLRDLAARVAPLGLGLEGRLDTPVGLLSGGERQVLTLLMATLVHPTLLLLDEHTAALDPLSAEQVLRTTTEVVQTQQLTTLMVTQSMQQAVRLGDRMIIMHRGRIARDLSGARKRRLRVDDLLHIFEQLRNDELLDQSAADLLRRHYV
jgi:putative ABC transport system ATP-binding protein